MLRTACRGSLPRPRCLVRANSTAAPPKPEQTQQTLPKKRSILSADFYGDIVIPSINKSSPRNGYTPGLGSLADDEFDGMGRFASRLARRQAGEPEPPPAKKDRTQPSAKSKDSNDIQAPPHLPMRPPPEMTPSASARDGQRAAQGLYNRAAGARDGNRRPQGDYQNRNGPRRNEGAVRAGGQQGAWRNQRNNARPEKKNKVVEEDQWEEDTGESLIVRHPQTAPRGPVEKVDLQALFGPAEPSVPAPLVRVPLDAVPATPGQRDPRVSRALEQFAGDYSRYLPPGLGSVGGNTLQKLGPVDHARLALSRVRAADPGRREAGVRIVKQLVATQSPASSGVEATL